MRWKKFKDLSPNDQQIIAREVSSEGFNVVPENSLWKVGKLKVESLPKTIVEQEWENPSKSYRDEDRKLDERRVSRIKESIKKLGYDRERPIFIEQRNRKSIFHAGGHHRLTATRQLKEEGILPPSFKIPTIIMRGTMFSDKDFEMTGKSLGEHPRRK